MTTRKYFGFLANALGALLLVLVVLSIAVEAVGYINRSPKNAETLALNVFKEVSTKNGYEALDFAGPEVSSTSDRDYTFRWSVRDKPNFWLLVHVSYLPPGVDHWSSDQLTEFGVRSSRTR